MRDYPDVHIAPLVTRRPSFSSQRQKHNPFNYLGFSSYLVIIFIEIESQEGALSYVVVGDRGGRTVEGESSRDRGISRPVAALGLCEAHGRQSPLTPLCKRGESRAPGWQGEVGWASPTFQCTRYSFWWAWPTLQLLSFECRLSQRSLPDKTHRGIG